MKFQIVSDTGYGLGIATHLSSEGHSVSITLNQPSRLGYGLVNVSNEADHADITIFDSDSFGRWADEERKTGKRVLGTSHWGQMLEKDPAYMQSVIALAGWDTESVQEGTNLYITTWFNGAHYISTYASMVYHRLMSSGRGPEIKTSAVVGNFFQPTERVCNEILRPLEPILRRTNHRGCCHIHLLINKDKYSVKGLSASFNTPTALLLLENTRSAVADVLLRLFDETSKPLQALEQWAVAVLLSVPPFPYEVPAEEYPLNGLEVPALKHLWLIDAKKEGADFTTAGAHGRVGYVTARGSYLQEAVKRAYRTIKNLKVHDLQYRDDIGRSLSKMLTELKEYLWLK